MNNDDNQKEINTYHVPVLLKESIEVLITNKSGIYIDSTFGGGGHSKEILKHLDKTGKIIAIDKDYDAKLNADKIKLKQFIFVQSDFKDLKKVLENLKIDKVDGILADLGVSSFQLNEQQRGFSTRFDSELDMRMDRNQKISAKEILNNYSEEKIAYILKAFGEFKNAKALAKQIINFRLIKEIFSTFDLKTALEKYSPKGKENKFFARIFQALRIETNQELENLKIFLNFSKDILKLNGRIVVISYHSLEDRLVKRFFKTGNFEGIENKDPFGNIIRPLMPVNNKVIIPTQKEIVNNNRSRSAKMRIATKILE